VKSKGYADVAHKVVAHVENVDQQKQLCLNELAAALWDAYRNERLFSRDLHVVDPFAAEPGSRCASPTMTSPP
jgi:hypothetical protein